MQEKTITSLSDSKNAGLAKSKLIENTYELILSGVNENKTFTDAEKAGAAFYAADSLKFPTVIHIVDGKKGRYMASTEIHGIDANGEQRFFKTLPNSHDVDAGFRTGYRDALQKSVNERLTATDWVKAKSDHPTNIPTLDSRLYNDLEVFSQIDRAKAGKAWAEHAPTDIVPPAFILHADDKTEKNVVEHDPERKQDIDREKDTVQTPHTLDTDQLQQQAKQDLLGQQAESKRVTVENLSEKAQEHDEANKLSERTGESVDYSEQVYIEREKNRQVELMERVHNQFKVSGSKFHFKDQPSRVAFIDKGPRMISASNDERVAHAMATMAVAKGWKTIRVSGHPDFKREVWMAASLLVIQTRGFKPQPEDLKELEKRREQLSKNIVEYETDSNLKQKDYQGQGLEQNQQQVDRDSGTDTNKSAVLRTHVGSVLAYGAAHYNHDPKEKKNYFVKLATDKGEETIWGVDLKRAIAESKTKEGDDVKLEFLGKQPVTVTVMERDKKGEVIGSREIDTNRNIWEVKKSDKHKVVEAVAQEIVNKKIKDPAQRDAIMKIINQNLDTRAKVGQIPSVPIYDKESPRRKEQTERIHPLVERDTERTR